MAVFESNYKELGFYCGGSLRTFKNGRYVTEDAAEIKALESIAEVKRLDEAEEKTEEAPKKKKASSAKSSEK